MNRNKKAKEDLIQRIEASKKSDEQIAYERGIKKQRNNVMITGINREIEYKKNELANGITETRTIHRIPDGTAVNVDGYTDNKKPKFMILNEIDALSQRSKEIEEEDLENMVAVVLGDGTKRYYKRG